jgi:glucose/arabinose dehydrogenase
MPSRSARLAALAFVLLLVAACGNGGTTSRPSSHGPSASAMPSASASDAAPSGSAASSAPPSASAPAGAFDPQAVAVSLEVVTEIPGAPLAVASPGDGSGRLFVAERGGRIWMVEDGQRSEQPFLDIATRVTAGGEAGLLGLAFHPGFPADPRFFIYYTNLDRDQVVAERRVSDDPLRADPDVERILLVMDDFAGNHNGGALQFGPDGKLYIATGDGGGANDPQGTGQRLDTPLGKILRIGVDATTGDLPYEQPADNPFVGRDGALPEIWETGLRNPWRFSFDRQNGDLWIGDVGQNAWEEIDVARGGEGGLNFGWSVTEGRHCFADEGCSTDGLTPPVTEYGHDQGCSVTGGVVYRGAAFPALVGAYLFADFCSGLVWAIDSTADDVATPVVVAESGRSISSFGEDEAGEVYATDLNGALLRLEVQAR